MDPLPLGRCTDKHGSKQCNRWATLICLHCNQGVCSEHYELHQHHIQIRADKLNNQINDLRQMLHTITQQQMIEHFQQKLDRWSEKCKNEIDLKHINMSAQLSKEMKQLNMDQFRSIQLNKIDQCIGKPLIDLLRIPDNSQIKHLQSLEQQFQQIQKTIDEMDSFVQITDEGQLRIDPSLNLIPAVDRHSLIDCPGAMAGSTLDHNYLLLFQSKPNFSLILIEDTKEISRTAIDYFVYDICWSQSTQLFLIATEFYLYEFDPLNNRLSKPYGNPKSSRMLWSLTCHLTDLYIIHKPDMIMYQRDLKKSFEKKKEWLKNEIMCEKGDQIIGSIRIDEQKQILGLSIKQIDQQWRVDLFSINNMQRLHYGSSFGIPTEINPAFCMITPLLNHYNQWLVQICTNGKSESILLDENAQVINKIDWNGYNVTLVGRDQLAFLDDIGIDIYQRESFLCFINNKRL